MGSKPEPKKCLAPVAPLRGIGSDWLGHQTEVSLIGVTTCSHPISKSGTSEKVSPYPRQCNRRILRFLNQASSPWF